MTTAEQVVKNVQIAMSNFDATLREKLERETTVILGDDDPTEEEIAFAVAKNDRIEASTSGVTFPKDGEALTPFEEVCLAAASS